MIEVSDLRFRWPGRALDVLDIPRLCIPTGERVFLRGASGSGKTTLLSLLGGVARAGSGHIRIQGTDLTTLGGPARDRFRAGHIGFVFQQFNLVPYLGLIDNVTLACRFSPERRARATAERSLEDEAHRLLSAMHLDVAALAGQPVAHLSVGQQQRVAAARALIGTPPLVIADEPTSSIDAEARDAFLGLLFGEIARAGSTLVFVSHDPGLGPRFDRTLELTAINHAATPTHEGA